MFLRPKYSDKEIPDVNWVEHYDFSNQSSTGKPFYYNKITKETTWNEPQEYIRWKDDALRHYLESIASPWRKANSNDGRTYYYNINDKQPKWEPPQEISEYLKFLVELSVKRKHVGVPKTRFEIGNRPDDLIIPYTFNLYRIGLAAFLFLGLILGSGATLAIVFGQYKMVLPTTYPITPTPLICTDDLYSSIGLDSGGCSRYFQGFDVTGTTNYVSVGSSDTIATSCDCMLQCQQQNATCSAWVWKFTAPNQDTRQCTLYSNFNLPSSVNITSNTNKLQLGGAVPSCTMDGTNTTDADPDCYSGPLFLLDSGKFMC